MASERETKAGHFCGRAIEHGVGVCQTETCATCPLALPPFPTPSEAQPMRETRKDAATCAHDWVPMIGGEVCYGCNQIRRYDSVTYTAPEPLRATPTPPEQWEVRDALVRVLGAATADIDAYEALGATLGLDDPTPKRIADALLARVPAEGVTGEPVAWCPRLADGRLQIEHASASLDEAQEDVQMLNAVPTASTDLPWQPVTVQPLYARATPPAAEGGREVTDAMVEAAMSEGLTAFLQCGVKVDAPVSKVRAALTRILRAALAAPSEGTP